MTGQTENGRIMQSLRDQMRDDPLAVLLALDECSTVESVTCTALFRALYELEEDKHVWPGFPLVVGQELGILGGGAWCERVQDGWRITDAGEAVLEQVCELDYDVANAAVRRLSESA